MSYKSNPMQLEMIPCRTCGEDMPKLRLTQYKYTYCVKCSETGIGEQKKVGMPVLMGEGDHTWVETVIMTEDQYRQYVLQEEAVKNLEKTNKAEILDFDIEDDKNLHGPVRIIDVDEN